MMRFRRGRVATLGAIFFGVLGRDDLVEMVAVRIARVEREAVAAVLRLRPEKTILGGGERKIGGIAVRFVGEVRWVTG